MVRVGLTLELDGRRALLILFNILKLKSLQTTNLGTRVTDRGWRSRGGRQSGGGGPRVTERGWWTHILADRDGPRSGLHGVADQWYVDGG